MSHKLFQATTVFFCLLSGLHTVALADDGIGERRTISVSGMGEAAGAPDQATVTAGVMTRAATVIEASKENQAAVERIMQALAKQNIESKDIQTADYGIWPEQRHDPRNSDEPVISGYRVNNLLRMNIKDISRLSSLLAAVTDAGANAIQNISFGVDDPSALEASARAAAMADARQKAEALANLAGVELGDVLQIQLSGGGYPVPSMGNRFALDAAAPAPGISAGQLSVTVQVQVTYAIR